MVFRNDSLAVVFQLQNEIKGGGSGSEKKNNFNSGRRQAAIVRYC